VRGVGVMPKEKIDTGSTFQVTVGWSRDREVQIGVGVVDGRSLFWQLAIGSNDTGDDEAASLDRFGNALAKSLQDAGQLIEADPNGPRYDPVVLARAVLNGLDVHATDGGSGYQWIWADLDRVQINRTIRALRRGRDQAFGRDE